MKNKSWTMLKCYILCFATLFYCLISVSFIVVILFQIYPHDQPMVFNPQNPNAPPIYPCGNCHKEVHDNDQAVLCESGCNFWFHR